MVNHRIATRVEWFIFIIGLLVLSLLPTFGNDYLLHVLVMVLLYAYLGSCWNIIGGYAGQFSFGHAAFYGIGAYTSSMLSFYWGVSPWIGFVAGGVLSGLFALGAGTLSFRYGLKGPFFALVTLAYAEMLRLVANTLKVTGAAVGLFLPLKGNSLLEFQFNVKYPYYYVILLMVTGIVIFSRWLERGKMGFYLNAIRGNENAAAASGVNIVRYKLIAFVISAFLTALGGTFYAQYYLFIDPIIVFGSGASIDILIRPIIGGVASVWGPIVGAFVLGPLSEFSRGLLRGYPGLDMMLYGAILIAVLLFMPHGIIGKVSEKKGGMETRQNAVPLR